MSVRPLAALPLRVIDSDDAAAGRVADLQARASRADGPVVNGVAPGPHLAGPCAFLVGRAALEFAYGEGRARLSSAAGWLPLIGRRFGRAVINSDEPDHAVERRQWGPLFTASRLARTLGAADAQVTDALREWSGVAEIDAYAAARTLSFRVMAQALAGVTDPDCVTRLGTAFATALDGPRPGETMAACQARLAPLRDALEDDLAKVVAAARHAGADAMGLVPVLLRADPAMDDAALVRHVGVLMVAGHETTGSLLARVLLALGDEADWQARLANEAVAASRAAALDLATLEALPLADAFVTEVARLHPPLLNVPRIAGQDFSYAGLGVPAGSTVALAIGATHRLPDHFTSPETFDPERFLGNRAALRTPAILTFATGARHCLGARFAMIEVKLLLMRLLSRWRVERVAAGATVNAGFWTARPAGALGIRLVAHDAKARHA